MKPLDIIDVYLIITLIILAAVVTSDYFKKRSIKKIKDDYKKSEPIDFNKKDKS